MEKSFVGIVFILIVMNLPGCSLKNQQYGSVKSKYVNDLEPLKEVTEEMRKNFGEVISFLCLKDENGNDILESCTCIVYPSGKFCSFEQWMVLEETFKGLGGD